MTEHGTTDPERSFGIGVAAFLVLALVFAWWTISPSGEEKAAAASAARAAAQAEADAAAALPECATLRQVVWESAKIVPKLGNLDCEKKGREYILILHYREAPASINQVRTLGAAAVGKALEHLQAQGVVPHAERIEVSVHSQRRVPGVTGKPLTEYYGHSYYSSRTDQIGFSPAK